MGNAVIVTTKMPSAYAEALLADLREQYLVSLDKNWDAEKYREVPDADRHESILADTR